MDKRIFLIVERGRQSSAILTAFMLPITTTGTAIALTLLTVFSLFSASQEDWRHILRFPAATLPISLFALLAISMLWSPQPFGPGGVSHYAKLLLIPIVMAGTYSQRQAMHIAYGFAAACMVLLVLSIASLSWGSGPWGWFKGPGVPVKDNAVQSTCFSLCAFGLGIYSIQLLRTKQNLTAVCAGVVAVVLFADVFLITLSKTGVLIALALAIRLLAYIDGWQIRVAVAIPLCLVAGLAVSFSSEAQRRVEEISTDLRALKAESSEATKLGAMPTTPPPHKPTNVSPKTKEIESLGNTSAETAEVVLSGKPTMSTASRLDFWSKAVEFIWQSPILGHGAGSTKSLYASVEANRPSPYGEAVPDPHNQFLAIAIQAGLLGAALLISMWAAHLVLFWGTSVSQVLGQAVVLQNILGSLFNSQLSQVTQGTLYCLAVGLLLAMLVRREPNLRPDASAPERKTPQRA